MKVLMVQSKVWWLVRPDEIRPEKGIIVVDAVRRVAETFKFAQAPTSLPGPNSGYTFQEGGFISSSGEVAIKELTIFSDGISIQTYSSSDDTISALEKVIALMLEMGFRSPLSAPQIIHHSFVTFDSGSQLNFLSQSFERIAMAIAIATDLKSVPDLKAIEYACDPKEIPPLEGKVFRIERRDNEPYSTNRWFSFATATSEKHIAALRTIDEIAATMKS